MRIILLALLVVCSKTAILSQPENNNYRTVFENFSRSYNSGNYDTVFSMFSSDMKAALPIDKTVEFFTALNSQFGRIKSKQFMRYVNGSYGSYKTNFEKGVLTINLSLDKAFKINGLFAKPYENDTTPKKQRNTTKLKLPFKTTWTVLWGGDTREVNHHIDNPSQRNAFDFFITDQQGKSHNSVSGTNEDFYAFGKELFAPCSGEIVLVVDGIKDNKPGVLNPSFISGNTVILKTVNSEYVYFAHFKQHSIKVREGQKVDQGQLLGLCGNSGNSSEPHLHFHIQNDEEVNKAVGIKCYFDKLVVNEEIRNDYSPMKGDKVKPSN